MSLIPYVAGGAVAGVLFFRWSASKFMALCDETWDASVISLRIEMGLYISVICGVFAWWDYPSVESVLLAIALWAAGMFGVIFR